MPRLLVGEAHERHLCVLSPSENPPKWIKSRLASEPFPRADEGGKKGAARVVEIIGFLSPLHRFNLSDCLEIHGHCSRAGLLVCGVWVVVSRAVRLRQELKPRLPHSGLRSEKIFSLKPFLVT
jgi:hypothetical protein